MTTRNRSLLCFVLAFGIGSLAAVACAPLEDEPDDSAAAATASERPLFVLVGGYSSCVDARAEGAPLAFAERAPALIDRLGGDVDVVSSCFGNRVAPRATSSGAGDAGSAGAPGGAGDAGARGAVDLRILEPNGADVASADAYGIDRDPTLHDLEPSLERLEDAVVRAEARQPGRPIVIVGHSHGGWLSLKLVERLPGTLRVRALVTIDPISPLHCSVASAGALVIGLPPAGCNEAPRDIDAEAQRRILARVGVWQHYYQTRFARLHSGPFSELSGERSIRVDPRAGGFFDNAHSLLASEPALWGEPGGESELPTIESVVATVLGDR